MGITEVYTPESRGTHTFQPTRLTQQPRLFGAVQTMSRGVAALGMKSEVLEETFPQEFKGFTQCTDHGLPPHGLHLPGRADSFLTCMICMV